MTIRTYFLGLVLLAAIESFPHLFTITYSQSPVIYEYHERKVHNGEPVHNAKSLLFSRSQSVYNIEVSGSTAPYGNAMLATEVAFITFELPPSGIPTNGDLN